MWLTPPAAIHTSNPPLPSTPVLLQGGNDYEIYSHGEVKGHTTTGPDDTVAQCRALFLS